MPKLAPAPKPLNLKGSKRADDLVGGRLGDKINAKQGDDTLTGNGGGDTLTGGSGADTFKYLSVSDSRSSSGIDRITDFSAAAGDKVDLSALGAATLMSAYNASFSGLQAVFAYNALTNTTTLSLYQGSSTAASQISFTGNVSYSPGAFLGIKAPPPPVFSVWGDTGTEGYDESVTFVVTRAGIDLTGTSTVRYSVTMLSGDKLEGTLTFAPGEETKEISAPIPDNTVFDGWERSIPIVLSDATNTTVSEFDGSTYALIFDDEMPNMVFIAESASANENDGQITFTVTRSGDISQELTVSYETQDITATDAQDYGPANGTVTFAAGAATAYLSIPVAHDEFTEQSEQFKVVLTGLDNPAFLIVNGVAIGTINPPQPTEGVDDLYGTSGDDVIDLLGGHDTYWAGEGNDTVYGGEGDDFLIGEGGDDVLYGGNGNDSFQGGGYNGTTGTNYLYGEGGNDSFTAQLPYWDFGGLNYIDGGSGTDSFGLSERMSAIANADGTVHVTAGDRESGYAYEAYVTNVETWYSSQRNGSVVHVDLGTLIYDVTLYGSNFADTLIGGSGNDTIYGGGVLGEYQWYPETPPYDTIKGGAGNDTIYGDGSATILLSGKRDDYTFSTTANGSVTVVDSRDGSPDGTDTLIDVLNVQFSDATVALVDVMGVNTQAIFVELIL